jgi:predicted amidohydrolase YtcJ
VGLGGGGPCGRIALVGSDAEAHESGGQTIAEYRELIAAYAQRHPEREWIVGSGWWMAAFPGGTPHRRELDALVPDRPVLLVNRDHHGAWVNSRALELAGITRDTADPADGRIERDADGGPFLPEQRVDLETAIAGYTRSAAFLNRLDAETGSIEVGKLADLVVLDRNLFEQPAGELQPPEMAGSSQTSSPSPIEVAMPSRWRMFSPLTNTLTCGRRAPSSSTTRCCTPG